MNEEQGNGSETPEEGKQEEAPEEPHEWNIEEISSDIIEKRPPNDKIITFGIPEEKPEEEPAKKESSTDTEPINAPEAPEENQ